MVGKDLGSGMRRFIDTESALVLCEQQVVDLDVVEFTCGGEHGR